MEEEEPTQIVSTLMPTRILILGATGRTGRLLVESAVAKGLDVNILVRDKNKVEFSHPNINIFEGTPLDKAILATAMKDCDAVISALNVSRTSDFPWAALRAPETFLSDSMRNIIEQARLQNTGLIMIVSAWGVGDTRMDIPFWFRWLIDHSNIGYAYKDHEAQENLLKNSVLDYTIVRPAGLTNSSAIKPVKVSINDVPKPGLTISRKAVAGFMIDALLDKLHVNQCVVVS